MKILVADDSKTNLALITSSLIKFGHTVLPVNNGEDAILAFNKEHPDLVILDVVMEGMDGFECAARMRTMNTEDWIPIIFLSSSVDDESIAKGINAGGDDYLTKPFSEITLAAKIQAMQRIAEMRKKLFSTMQELKKISSTDALTGLYNRLQFEKSIKERLAASERHNHNLAVLFIDLDHFKTVNDSLGHHIGDLLIQETAKRLRACLREEDFLARIGGDEFIVILSEVPSQEVAGEVAQKIIDAITPVYNLMGNTIRISSSVGIAFYPMEGVTPQNLTQSADMAMYYAKESGRNNFKYFTTDLNNKYKRQISLEHELKFALERNQLFITYQPIYNLLTQEVVGMEALIRWRHPEYGLISPNIFIPIAEETGLITEIGAWVLKNVCKQGAEWVKMGFKDFILSVNLSLQQFLQTDFFEMIIDIIHQEKMPPNQLELELTETTVITYTNHLKKTIKQLREMGISISIDDFGTRYSSLTSLKYLPINTLKIDKAFMKDVITDEKNNVIVKALIALGNSMNLNVIAEGVQSEEQKQFLILNGCYHGQGFFLSKPLDSEEMTGLLLTKQSESRPTNK